MGTRVSLGVVIRKANNLPGPIMCPSVWLLHCTDHNSLTLLKNIAEKVEIVKKSWNSKKHSWLQVFVAPGPQIRVRNWKLFFLFLNQNVCCGYLKEPSRWDGSFENPKHMFKLMDKKIITILRLNFLLNCPYKRSPSIANIVALVCLCSILIQSNSKTQIGLLENGIASVFVKIYFSVTEIWCYLIPYYKRIYYGLSKHTWKIPLVLTLCLPVANVVICW